MEFNNPSVDTSTLPRAEDVKLQPIEPSFWKVLQLEWLITAVILLAIGGSAIFFIKAIQKPLVIGIAAGAWFLTILVYYFIISQSFKRKAYALREKDAMYRSGWITRVLHICPYNRIQHCSIHAGPLERRFGLASISLYTSGSDGSDIRIPGLTESTAASIREFIMQKVRTDDDTAG